jgi:hypothetical protein
LKCHYKGIKHQAEWPSSHRKELKGSILRADVIIFEMSGFLWWIRLWRVNVCYSCAVWQIVWLVSGACLHVYHRWHATHCCIEFPMLYFKLHIDTVFHAAFHALLQAAYACSISCSWPLTGVFGTDAEQTGIPVEVRPWLFLKPESERLLSALNIWSIIDRFWHANKGNSLNLLPCLSECISLTLSHLSSGVALLLVVCEAWSTRHRLQVVRLAGRVRRKRRGQEAWQEAVERSENRAPFKRVHWVTHFWVHCRCEWKQLLELQQLLPHSSTMNPNGSTVTICIWSGVAMPGNYNVWTIHAWKCIHSITGAD